MRNLPEKKGYAKHVRALGDDLYAVEHFKALAGNAAVVVMKDGLYLIGIARLNPKDNYSRKLGHEIAVGRALARAVRYKGILRIPNINQPDFGWLWEEGATPLVGRELGHLCRKLALAHLLNS